LKQFVKLRNIRSGLRNTAIKKIATAHKYLQLNIKLCLLTSDRHHEFRTLRKQKKQYKKACVLLRQAFLMPDPIFKPYLY